MSANETVKIKHNTSVMVGIAALVATALAFFGFATFIGSFLTRHEKKYRALDLLGIGLIAAALIAAGFALAWWSGFHIGLFGCTLSGPAWLVVGLIAALIVTRNQHALYPVASVAKATMCYTAAHVDYPLQVRARGRSRQAADRRWAAANRVASRPGFDDPIGDLSKAG